MASKIHVKIYFDGSCYNGKRIGLRVLKQVDKSCSTMGIGVVSVVNGKPHETIKKSPGVGTNNIAEWLGCVYALKLARAYYRNYDDVMCTIYTDSQLIANQFNGVFAVKQKEFKEFYDKAKAIAKELPGQVALKWIPREENKLADAASKAANPYYDTKNKKSK